MRTLSAPERAKLALAERNDSVVCEVQNADGTWMDLTNLGGVDWLTAAQWGGDIDAPVKAGTVTLARRINTGNKSLSPLMTGSVLNVNGAGAYAPLLDGARGIRLKTAVTARGAAPVSGDWKYVIQGVIDRVGLKGSNDESLMINFRDSGAVLQNTIIRTPTTYAVPTAPETLIQSILDAWINVPNVLGAGAVTLYTPVASGTLMSAFTLPRGGNVMEAIQNLATQIGWVVRYKYDSANVWRLTFYKPNRAQTVSDETMGPTEYFDVEEFALDVTDLRNTVDVWYTDSVTGLYTQLTRTDAPSIAKYREQAMIIEENFLSQIDTSGEAGTLADAAIADLSEPKADETIRRNYWWPVEDMDLYTFLANGVHYDTDQQRAVVSFQHTLENGEGVTTLTTRGKPAGLYLTWKKFGTGTGDTAGTEGPSLTVTDAPGATPSAAHSVAYIGIYDTISLSLNGGAWGAPASSPLSVTPNGPGGADKQLTFQATRNGQTISQTVVVKAVPPALAPVPTIVQVTPHTTSEDLSFSAVLGEGGTAPLSWRWRVVDALSGAGAWSNGGLYYPNSGATAFPYAQNVVRGLKTQKTVQLDVQDADGNGAIESYILDPYMPGIDQTYGNVADGTALNSGFMIFNRLRDVASDVVETSGLHFTSPTMLDSSHRIVNVYRVGATEVVDNLFKKSTDTSAAVVTTASRAFVDPASVGGGSTGAVVIVYRLGVNESVDNLVKIGDVITSAMLPATGSFSTRLGAGGAADTTYVFRAYGDTQVDGHLTVTGNAILAANLRFTAQGDQYFKPVSAARIAFESAHATISELNFQRNDGTSLGSVYGDSTSSFGLLTSDGYWFLKTTGNGAAAGVSLYGSLTLPSNTQHYSDDGKGRLQFVGNGATYIASGESSGPAIYLRDGSNNYLADFIHGGGGTLYGAYTMTGDLTISEATFPEIHFARTTGAISSYIYSGGGEFTLQHNSINRLRMPDAGGYILAGSGTFDDITLNSTHNLGFTGNSAIKTNGTTVITVLGSGAGGTLQGTSGWNVTCPFETDGTFTTFGSVTFYDNPPFVRTTTSTIQVYSGWSNGGGDYKIGVDNSAGSYFGTGAYTFNIQVPTGRAFAYIIGTTPKFTIDSGGAALFSSGLVGVLNAAGDSQLTLDASGVPFVSFKLSGSEKAQIYWNSGKLHFYGDTYAADILTLDTTSGGINVTGDLTSTVSGEVFNRVGTSTVAQWLTIGNTSGTALFGVEGSSPARVAGSNPYETFIRGAGIILSADSGSSVGLRMYAAGGGTLYLAWYCSGNFHVGGTLTQDGRADFGADIMTKNGYPMCSVRIGDVGSPPSDQTQYELWVGV